MKRSKAWGAETSAGDAQSGPGDSSRSPRPSTALREAVRQQLDALRSAREFEFDYVLERVRVAAPEVAEHPFLPDLLRDRHRGRTLDMPRGWLDEAPEECRNAVDRLPWAELADEESISLARCRKLLGRRGVAFSDDRLRLLRSVLHAVADVVVDDALEAHE